MKIGVNLIQYIDVQGIEVFAYSILRELVLFRDKDDFVFFVNEKSRKIFDFPNVEYAQSISGKSVAINATRIKNIWY